MKKSPMPKGNSLKSNKTPAKPSPASKTQMPAGRAMTGGKRGK